MHRLTTVSRSVRLTCLALQLPFCFEVRPLGGRLVSPAPEYVCGLDPLPSESDGDAADFLD
jgi:hypothetical protein